MELQTAMMILKLVELGMVYGPGIVSAALSAIYADKQQLTMDDIATLEASLKHPSEYMTRPSDAQEEGGGV